MTDSSTDRVAETEENRALATEAERIRTELTALQAPPQVTDWVRLDTEALAGVGVAVERLGDLQEAGGMPDDCRGELQTVREILADLLPAPEDAAEQAAVEEAYLVRRDALRTRLADIEGQLVA